MKRFFWVVPQDEDLTIAEMEDRGDWDQAVYWIPGHHAPYYPEELVIGAEIHASKTGLLAALNDVK